MHIKLLESIQRKFCKYLYNKQQGHYPERNYPHPKLLEDCKVLELRSRREYLSLMFLYKLWNGLIVSSNLLSQFNVHVPRTNARNPIFFSTTIAKSNQHNHSPVFDMSHVYNKYRQALDLFSGSLSQFRYSCTDIVFK